MNDKLVVGIGNPGPEFEDTYHNIGLIAIRKLAAGTAKGGDEPAFKRYKGLFEYEKRGGMVFVRSLLFMNDSGRAVKEAARMFQVRPAKIAVVHDESDLPLGAFKLSFGGSSAGHKGVQSVIDHLKSPDFWRVRIGVREKNETGRKKAGDFVLAKIKKNEEDAFDGVFEEVRKELAKEEGPF
jgi:peptidyl-tRNA hydrolase, PTH1 family